MQPQYKETDKPSSLCKSSRKLCCLHPLKTRLTLNSGFVNIFRTAIFCSCSDSVIGFVPPYSWLESYYAFLSVWLTFKPKFQLELKMGEKMLSHLLLHCWFALYFVLHPYKWGFLSCGSKTQTTARRTCGRGEQWLLETYQYPIGGEKKQHAKRQFQEMQRPLLILAIHFFITFLTSRCCWSKLWEFLWQRAIVFIKVSSMFSSKGGSAEPVFGEKQIAIIKKPVRYVNSQSFCKIKSYCSSKVCSLQ